MNRIKKTWRLLPHNGAAIQDLAAKIRVAPVVAQLLLNRGVADPDDAKRFLQAPLNGLYEPERLPGVVEAAERIYSAVRDERPICVFGDYDVDGVSGTAILLAVLRALGAAVDWRVPNRFTDGYGLNSATLQQIAADGGSLVVTVDCGITSVAEAEEAKRLGLELIVTDHHEFKPQLPDAAVLVHPRLPDSDYPFGGLSGAGVALKLAWAVAKLASGGDKVETRLREVLLDAVALAALGAVADVMPLHDENRILVRHGLARLRLTEHAGVRALLQVAGVDRKPKLAASDIGFILAPRLNAAGRLASARTAVELLTATTPIRAEDLAGQLNEHNQQRQKLERRIFFDALDMIDKAGLNDRPALVLANSNWHQGLIGIVAGRMADRYGRPALMISLPRDDKPAVGSGRSIPGFKLHEALAACDEHLDSHGGHAAAAGFRLRPTAVPGFHARFVEVAGEAFPGGPPPPSLTIDAEVPLATLSLNVVESLAWLEPYGVGNPQPLFLAGDLEIVGEPKLMGADQRHLHFHVSQGGQKFRAVAFRMADRIDELMSGQNRCCLAFTPQINEWGGWSRVELLVRDFQAGPRAELG